MQDNHLPREQWKAKIHVALNSKTKLRVRDTITNPASTYDELKEALLGCRALTVGNASESLMTSDKGETLALPSRQAQLRYEKLLERVAKDATSPREIYSLIASAVVRYHTVPELKLYLDMKGQYQKEALHANIDEWLTSKPPGMTWSGKRERRSQPYERSYPSYPGFRHNSGRKSGECFYCGKLGHFAQDCRSRTNRERPPVPMAEQPSPVGKREHTPSPQASRSHSETICFKCKQKGHMSRDCPRNNNRVRQIRIPEGKLVSLGHNEVFGSVGPHRMPITLDTGAAVSVVLEECVEQSQMTGRTRQIKTINEVELTGKECNIRIAVGDTIFDRTAVTQPGHSIGWIGCLSLNPARDEEREFLGAKFKEREAMTELQTLYLPPEVREGCVVSGILASEALVVKEIEKIDKGSTNVDENEKEPVQSTVVEAQNKQVEVQADEQSGDGDVLVLEQSLEAEEAEGGTLEEGAESEGEQDLCMKGIRKTLPREGIANETEQDVSLRAVYDLGLQDKQGYHLVEGLLFRTRLDLLGNPTEQLCIPSSYRSKCLHTAHNNFGHQGRNKMLLLLKPHFYWPSMSKDCQAHIRSCVRCQELDKTSPKPNLMTERTVVTVPFQDVAIDVVGPFPTAVGGFRFLLTCIDAATRWPEAIPVRKASAKVVISCLTDIFSRSGFPSKLTSDNGSQFAGKVFSKWLRDKGIQHSRSTPYHPQGNGMVERLHRTLTGIIAKTAEAKGNWAKVVPMALYFLRCTPSASTGVSPFLLTHGWEPVTPLQVLYQSWVQSDMGGVDLSQWVLENTDRLECARDVATSKQLEVIAKRKDVWDKKARPRSFCEGDLVWVRKPELDMKLRESWEGPGKVLKVNSPMSYRVETNKRVIPTIHIQQLKSYHQPQSVKRVTAVLEQDSEGEDILDRYAEAKVELQQLSETQQHELQAVLDKHNKVLDKEPGLTKLVDFDIDTGYSKPIYQRPYSTPVALRKSVDTEIDWLISKGYIRPSSSPWASPMVMVRKADGTARLCVDFRKINGLTRQIPFYMPRVEEVIEGVGQARFISKLDLSKGYYQVQLTPAAIAKTAFTSHRGTYEFTRMPFGVKNAPACFQELMQWVLAEHRAFSTAYMDDVVVFSRTWEDHLKHVDEVLQALGRAGLTANPKKCSWGGRAVEFLGHWIGGGTMAVPTHRCEAMTKYQRPTTKKGLRAFIGSIGYYRWYIKDLASQT